MQKNDPENVPVSKLFLEKIIQDYIVILESDNKSFQTSVIIHKPFGKSCQP